MTGRFTRLAFDVGEPIRLLDRKTLATWEGVPLDEVAIRYSVSDRQIEEECEIEGVPVRVLVRDVRLEDENLLRDFVSLAEPLRGDMSADELVARTRAFFTSHEPLCLCDHGRGSAHDAQCDSLLAGRERVGHVLALAQRCLAAMTAADGLRNGEPIYQAEETTLDLEEASLLPLEWALRVKPEDQPKLARRLRDPIVSDWRRLEEFLARLRAEAVGGLGCLPPLMRQLSAACHRDGYRRVCKNPECDNDFTPSSSRHLYCDAVPCNRSRGLQRQRKMAKCPRCGRSLGKANMECYFCGTLLS